MRAFYFSLNTLLQVKSHAFERDLLALANAQKQMHQLERRREELQAMCNDVLEEAVIMPMLGKQATTLKEKIECLDKEMAKEKRRVTLCQKMVSDSLHKRKAIEKIKESEYAIYQKECARIDETQPF